MANDGWASDYLRQLNTQGPGNPGNVVSSKVQYVPPVSRGGQGSDWADTSDIPLAPGQNPESSVYSNAPGARMGQLKPRSGYNPPAGGGYTAETFPSSGAGARRYARPKVTQSRSRDSAPANGVKTRSAPLSGSDVTADVMKAVKAAGNTSFANWRQSLVDQGWTPAEAHAVRYDPSTGKFMSNASGQAATDHYMREQADKDAGIMADNPGVEGKVSGQTPAKTEGGAQPAPASGAQPAPAKTEGGAQPAPVKTEGGAQPAPADDHEQEVKAAVVEFLKQHPADGKERLKSIYEAVGSQNIKDDAAYNLAVLAEIQKASTASGDTSDVDSILNNPGNTGAADLGKAVSLERQAQTESGVNDYQDQIREGINWLRMNAAKAQAAAEAAEQRSDNPEGWL